MRDENILRRKAQKAIRDRKMPRRYPERLWGGPGTGARCTICDEPVGGDDIEFELEFPPGDDRPGLPDRDNPRVHTRCFSEWESACRDLEEPHAAAPARFENAFPADKGVLRGSS